MSYSVALHLVLFHGELFNKREQETQAMAKMVGGREEEEWEWSGVDRSLLM